MGSYKVRLNILFLFLLLTSGGVGYLVFSVQQHQETQVAHLENAYDQLELLDSLLLALVDAQSGQRGFIITGQEEFLQPYVLGVARVESLLQRLRNTVRQGSANVSRVITIEATVGEILPLLERVIAVMRTEGPDAASDLVRSKIVKREMDHLRQLIHEWMAIERAGLIVVSRDVSRAADMTRTSIIVGFSLSGLFLVLSLGLIGRESKQRGKALVALTASRNELEGSLAQQQKLLEGRERLRFFSEALQGCRNLEEAQQVLAKTLPALVGVPNGALAIQNPSRVYLEVVSSWGDVELPSKPMFEPTDCFSLRRGRAVWCDEPQRDLRCPHLGETDSQPTVCYPLNAHNQVLGCLVVWGEELRGFGSDRRDLLAFAAETFSMVLSNLRLDETLRFQAIRDPLTGLYNRRHMESSLDRELARAKRGGECLAVVMADIDHFKGYNDTHGHDAADTVLSAVGKLLATSVREEDVACRYGGEEFLLMLPDISLDRAVERASQIRADLEQMRFQFYRETLPGVTVSLGMALYPAHGESAEALIHAADQALYRAKRNGRNRIEVAGDVTLETPAT